MSYNQGSQLQVLPVSPTVKKLIFLNVGVWFFLQVVLEQFFFPNWDLAYYLGLVVENVFTHFYIWQFGTYLFLHDSQGVMHLVFNMLSLWWIGSELEMLWGSRKFLIYYLTCGIGAGVLYFLGVIAYSFTTNNYGPLQIPVVGASGAIFGLFLAYGILFGERIMHFMFLFPMKAKYFIMLIAGIEVVMLLNQGISGGQAANLAHLGGLVIGFLYLIFWARIQRRNRGAGAPSKKGKLKLVVNNEKPKYWN